MVPFNLFKAARAVSTPVEVRWELAKHPNIDVRMRVADANSTPPEILEFLAHDPSWLVRTHLAYNKVTPQNVLVELLSDPDDSVRLAAVQNKNTPRAAFHLVVNDTNGSILRSIAGDTRLPKELYKQMADNFVEREDGWELGFLAQNPAIPPQLMQEIYDGWGKKSMVREGLCRNPKMLPSILISIFNDLRYKRRDMGVVIQNPRLPLNYVIATVDTDRFTYDYRKWCKAYRARKGF